MIYQFNPDMLADACFQAGDLKYIKTGNDCRLLDPRRTPLRVVDVNVAIGVFVVEILGFEDKGWQWEIPFESVGVCQFANGSTEASDADVAAYRDAIARLDRALTIDVDASRLAETERHIAALRSDVARWLDRKSAFVQNKMILDIAATTGNPSLWSDLEHFMLDADLLDIEQQVSEHYVRSHFFGETVKGHCIVLAELGLAPYTGKQIRSTEVLEGRWTKERRAAHIVHRLAFLREVLARCGHPTLVLYRGMSSEGRPDLSRRRSLVSATFSLDVAMSLFNERDRSTTGLLLRQTIPVNRLFMSFLETAQMNRTFKEREAVLLNDRANELF